MPDDVNVLPATDTRIVMSGMIIWFGFIRILFQ
jgi:hypothetical protein